MEEYLPLLEEELALRGDDGRAPQWRKTDVAPDVELPRRDHRRGHVGPARRAPARTGGRRLRGVGEERRRRWHLVREPVSRLPGRQPQPQLQLLVRAAARLAVPLLHPGRAARLLPHLRATSSGWPSTSGSAPRCGPPPGTTTDGSWTLVDPQRRRGRGHRRRRRGHRAPSASSTGRASPTSRVATVRRRRLPLRRWDHDVALDGERVAVIGTGASSVQFIPEIAPAPSTCSSSSGRRPGWDRPRTTTTPSPTG